MGRGRKARIFVRVVQRKACNLILSHVDMERIKAELELSRDLFGVLHVTEKELGPKLKLLIALELFREEKISSGKAAEVAGLSKSEFIDELDWRGIPYFTETPEELAAQVEAMRRLFGDS
jgi:predicted HTH domain antitoxin